MKILKFLGELSAAAFTGFFFGYFGASLYCSPPVTTSDCAAWVGAVGSVGALIGAIWIATEQQRRTFAKEQELAALAAGSLILRLKQLVTKIDGCLKDFSTLESIQYFPMLEEMASELMAAQFWETEEVLPLASLPDNIAIRLEVVRSGLKQAAANMQTTAKIGIRPLTNEEAGLLDFLRRPVQKARLGLVRSIKQCEEVLRKVEDI